MPLPHIQVFKQHCEHLTLHIFVSDIATVSEHCMHRSISVISVVSASEDIELYSSVLPLFWIVVQHQVDCCAFPGRCHNWVGGGCALSHSGMVYMSTPCPMMSLSGELKSFGNS